MNMLNKEEVKNLYNLALMFFNQGKYEKAKIIMEQLAKLSPNSKLKFLSINL